MRFILASLMILGMSVVLFSSAVAGDKKVEKKEVTLKGKVCCAKCELGETKACETVIVVKEGDKSVTYFFSKASHKEHHDAICAAAKTGTVVGTVSEEGKRKVVDAKKVTFE
jgi:hypothetical protein